MSHANPGEDPRIDILLRQARSAWTAVLKLSMAKDRMVNRDLDTTEIDQDIAGTGDTALDAERQLLALGYRPTWMDQDPIVREEKRRRKKRARRRPMPRAYAQSPQLQL